MENINTHEYWESRFASGDWEDKHGRWQTQNFALGQLKHLPIPRDFSGKLLDYGCGLGDAMPVYRERFPNAKLFGADISESAMENARRKYGNIATFQQAGTAEQLPQVDVIIASNVLEHLDDNPRIVKGLLTRCKELHVIVPYQESPRIDEHVNTYTRDTFGSEPYRTTVFACRGWSEYGWDLWYRIRAKNPLRPLLGKPVVKRKMQVAYSFRS